MNISVNLWAVLVATVVQFIVGAIWYMPIFGKLWGQIHGFDKLSKKEQDAARKGMMPWMLVQLLVTVLTAYVLAHVVKAFPNDSAYMLAFWMWLGFMLPTQASAVIFGGTEPRWVWTKIAVMAGGALACVEAAALVFTLMK